MLVRSSPMKSRKRLARDVLDTSATRAELVHDVTDTYSHTQNGSAHSSVLAAFKGQVLTNQTINRLNSRPPPPRLVSVVSSI